MIKDLNARIETKQFLEENASVSFGDLGIGRSFLDMAPKNKPQKKINKLDFIKISYFCASKDSKKEKN